ncbi:MAG: S8 family serine peptidase [Bacteriovorax sp.]|nr:S8 family serine peptidase [Bacteriovorax sp.]
MQKNISFPRCVRGFSILMGLSLYAGAGLTADFSAFESSQVNLDKSWFLTRIGAPLFWQKSTGSKEVKVLVCDTGIESNHPDLKANISLPGQNFVDGSTNTEPTGNAHGTRIAGVIGALGLNGGAVGINLNVKIVPGKISNVASGMAMHTDTAKCIKWGADQGIKIVNVSFSGGLDEPVVHDAAKYLHDKGGVLIMSAGNVWGPRDLPNDPYIIAVGMVNQIDWKTQFDSFGPFVDMVAPGTTIYTTDVGGKYIEDKGSSLSAAVVSGAAALILSVRPDLSADELTEVLFRSTVDLGTPGRDDAFGVGRLDLSKTIDILNNL